VARPFKWVPTQKDGTYFVWEASPSLPAVRRNEPMKKTIKILHIDLNWDVFYILIQTGTLIKSTIPLKTAIALLKKVNFDLILSEPQNKAVLTPQTVTDHIEVIRDSFAKRSAGTEPFNRLGSFQTDS
jgi:hypothetical protein